VTGLYNWTEDEDEIATDAVTVGIRSDTRFLTIGGLQFGQREAVVYWPDWPGSGYPVEAALEGPMAVEAALRRAEVLRRQYAFPRVAVWVQHREMWDDRWGKLAPSPGL
jgi:hypothetical protein